MNNSLELKEQIIHEFIQTISDINSKPSDEIENDLEKIIHKSRGLIHKELMWSFKKTQSNTEPHQFLSV